jgi:hypothetical protein
MVIRFGYKLCCSDLYRCMGRSRQNSWVRKWKRVREIDCSSSFTMYSAFKKYSNLTTGQYSILFKFMTWSEQEQRKKSTGALRSSERAWRNNKSAVETSYIWRSTTYRAQFLEGSKAPLGNPAKKPLPREKRLIDSLS